MSAPTLVLLAVATLASPILGPPAALAPPNPSTRPSAVALRVDGKALLEHEGEAAVEHTTAFVRDDVLAALDRLSGTAVVDDPRAPAIVVTLAWVRHEDSVYGVTVEARRPGEAPALVERFECECIGSELATAVAQRLPAALDQLAPATAASATTGPSAPQGEPTHDEGSRRPLGPLGKAGIGALAVGTAATIAGGIVLAQGRRYDEQDPELEVWQGRDFRPPGVAVMVVGGAVAVTGAVLLVVDRVRARKAPDGSASRRPRLAPHGPGMALTLRF